MKTPDEILREIESSEKKKSQGKLKIFLGMCAGVGKTYSMLQDAHQLLNSSKKVVVGLVETHGRIETEELLNGLEVIPKKKLVYKDVGFEEFDLETAIQMKPDYILLDELAHTNIPGSKYAKRYLDVIELLKNGINVLTTLNVQHIESRIKTVEQITGITINETVPDSILEMADYVELVDISIDELKKRLQDGKVYVPEKAKIASSNFFRDGNLISLREMALRLTAEKVDSDLIDYKREKQIQDIWKANEKLLVAVGPSPYSAELIRTTRRMAYILKSKWYAVYVKTDTIKNQSDEEQLEKNLRLAKELGAEVITTTDTNFVEGILSIARAYNISQIVIGKPSKYNLLNYLKKDNYIDELIQKSGDINIILIRPSLFKGKKAKKTFKIDLNTTKKEYLFSILSVILLSALCFPLTNYIGYQSIGLILLLNLLLMPFYAGRGAIIVNAFLTSVLWNFFFIQPLFTFNIHNLYDVLTLIINFVVAITTGFLISKIRKQQSLVKNRAKYLLALLNFTKELSSCSNKNEAIYSALDHIGKNLNLNVTYFDSKSIPVMSSDYLYDFDEKEKSIAQWVLDNNKIAGKYSENLPSSIGQYFPLVSSKSKIGVFCILVNKKLQIDEENLIINIIDQLLSFYEKFDAEENVQKLLIEAETNKLYNTLLDSISHEFKTPIAVILGSSTSLQQPNIINNPELINNFANEISIASLRLNVLVEHLLDISRLETGKLILNKNYYHLDEIIADVLIQLKNERENRNIKIDLIENPILFVDYGLICQAFFNIIHNALKYTSQDTIINIKTKLMDNQILISISDNGLGLKTEEIANLFTKFYRPPSSKSGGTGLGLSIAKGFIEAHQGTIKAKSNNPSGLIFDILLPI